METVLTRLRTPLHFLLSNIGCLVFQTFILAMLAFGQGFASLLVGHFFWTIDDTHQVGQYVWAIGAFAGILALCYALLWWMFWWVLEAANGRIQWFFWKVAFSTLPFFVVLFLFNPQPNPLAMIPTSHAEYQFIFSCSVTGLVLYPFYSALLYQTVLKQETRRWKGFMTTGILSTVVGAAVFISAWHIMNPLYHLT